MLRDMYVLKKGYVTSAGRWGEGKRRARGGVRMGESEPEGTGRREDGESKSDDEFDV